MHSIIVNILNRNLNHLLYNKKCNNEPKIIPSYVTYQSTELHPIRINFSDTEYYDNIFHCNTTNTNIQNNMEEDL